MAAYMYREMMEILVVTLDPALTNGDASDPMFCRRILRNY
jgi:hypothetical protein